MVADYPASWRAGHPHGAISALTAQVPSKWERLGDMALLPNQCFLSPVWASLSDELWEAVAAALGVVRLARQSSIANAGVPLRSNEKKRKAEVAHGANALDFFVQQ